MVCQIPMILTFILASMYVLSQHRASVTGTKKRMNFGICLPWNRDSLPHSNSSVKRHAARREIKRAPSLTISAADSTGADAYANNGRIHK